MKATAPVCVWLGEALAAYGFGEGHPFSTRRHQAFADGLKARGLMPKVCIREPVEATASAIERFHTHEYVEMVKAASARGVGFLDYGDTPAFPGVYSAAASVVGSVLDAVARIMTGECRRGFVPIAGLHHARREKAAGFCVFNDCGVAIETLRREYGLERIAYVDIDAHHGDGVFYAFDDQPWLCFADIHEDGRYLYPGSGGVEETGRGEAVGTKLNVPMSPGSGDEAFFTVWEEVESFVEAADPQFILLQCGADSLDADPIAHLRYSERTHVHAARRLSALADRRCDGRLLALGGGGYDLANLAAAWTGVVEALGKT